MKKYLIKNAQIVNENKIFHGDILINNQCIEKIGSNIQDANAIEIDAENHICLPGAIDDQVHFREPGLTHKATIYTESKAAVAGGVTTFFEMPNTVPQATTQALLEDKYQIAAKNALANYSFFMGTTNDNYEEVIKTNPLTTCGIKIFMGSSTGNMLVDDQKTLERIFANAPTIIATHCEDEATVKNNMAFYSEKYGDRLDATYHSKIRNSEACFLSSSMAVELAKKNNTRLHILHISTARETFLFDNTIPLKDKKITSEACIHHLWFSDKDYETKGNWIKWNPAVKSEDDRTEIWKALLDGRIDVIATDHAPHTIEEKEQTYSKAPSGGPLVQHSWQAMLDFYEQGKISLETIVEKMCHNPAILFNVKERGYIREGYFADLVLVKKEPQKVTKDNLFYKCNWSPFEQHEFQYTVKKTFVNGHLAYENGQFDETKLGQRISFDR
jgi:dihydroorotase